MDKQMVATVGGTGHLGTLISNSLLDKPRVEVRFLVCPESHGKAAGFEKRGARIVEGAGAGDGSDVAQAGVAGRTRSELR